jgi:hypothetical protein
MTLVVDSRPEAELLLCCARTRVEARTAERIGALLERELNWQFLIQTAVAHRVTPLLSTTLSATYPEAVPEPVLRELRDLVLTYAERDLLVAQELPRVLGVCEARDIRAIPFKGPLLAASVYGNLALRRFYDLDILVQSRDVLKASDALRSLMYRQEGHRALGWEYHFVEEGGRWLVDLHERVASRYFPTPATFDELWTRRRPVVIDGKPILTFGPEDLLLVLSVQLAKDCRSWKQRLMQICDAAELIRTSPDLDWEFVLQRARVIGGMRILLLELRLANELLDAALPERVHRIVYDDRAVRTLAEEVRARLFPPPAGPGEALPIGTGIPISREDSWFHLRVRERVPDKLRYLCQVAQSRVSTLVTPTYRDRSFLALPEPLGFLYYLVRPVRILLQWARTGRLKARAG